MDCQTDFYDNLLNDDFLGCLPLTDLIEVADEPPFMSSELRINHNVDIVEDAENTNMFASISSGDFLTDMECNNDGKTILPRSIEYSDTVLFKTDQNFPDSQFIAWEEDVDASKLSTPTFSRQESTNFGCTKMQQKYINASDTSLLIFGCATGKRIPARPKLVLPKSLDGSPSATHDEIAKKNVPLFRGREVSEKILKRQIRMIKNRESANLSRKKKRDYVVALENRVSELMTENMTLKTENESLKAQIKSFHNAYPGSCNDQGIKISSLNSKNTAILLAMIFMISLNFGNINNFLSKSSRNANELKPDKFQTGRRLLWIKNSSDEKFNKYSNMEILKDAIFPMCPVPINQTENIRLASELRKWIADNRFGNQSLRNVSYPYAASKQGRKAKRFQARNLSKRILKGKHEDILERVRRGKKMKREEMHIFNLKKKEQFSGVLKKINRQADTFYVLAFNADHLLLPADVHNKIMRPKMSFVLPAGNVLFEKLTSLMQIDCVVMNTSAIQLEENDTTYNLRNMSGDVSPAGRSKDDIEETIDHPSKAVAREISLNEFILDKESNDFVSMLPIFSKKKMKPNFDIF